jgi:hypothetical protein
MLKKSASGVLASLRGSTYRNVRLASSLAAALLDSLFEHPAEVFSSCLRRVGHRHFVVPKWFFRSLLNPSICSTACENATVLLGQ